MTAKLIARKLIDHSHTENRYFRLIVDRINTLNLISRELMQNIAQLLDMYYLIALKKR